PRDYQLDLAATDRSVWVLAPDSSVVIDPATGDVVATLPVGGVANAASGGSSWVIGDPDQANAVVRLTPDLSAPAPTGPGLPSASPGAATPTSEAVTSSAPGTTAPSPKGGTTAPTSGPTQPPSQGWINLTPDFGRNGMDMRAVAAAAAGFVVVGDVSGGDSTDPVWFSSDGMSWARAP